MLFRDWLQGQRRARGLSTRGLFAALDTRCHKSGRRGPASFKTIESWEQFNRASPEFAQLLADFFGVPVEEVKAGMTAPKRGTTPNWRTASP